MRQTFQRLQSIKVILTMYNDILSICNCNLLQKERFPGMLANSEVQLQNLKINKYVKVSDYVILRNKRFKVLEYGNASQSKEQTIYFSFRCIKETSITYDIKLYKKTKFRIFLNFTNGVLTFSWYCIKTYLCINR